MFIQFAKMIDVDNTSLDAGFIFLVETKSQSDISATCLIDNNGTLSINLPKECANKEKIAVEMRYFFRHTSLKIVNYMNNMWEGLIAKGIVKDTWLKQMYVSPLNQDDILGLKAGGVHTLTVPDMTKVGNKEYKREALSAFSTQSYYEDSKVNQNRYLSIYNLYSTIPINKNEMKKVNSLYHDLISQ